MQSAARHGHGARALSARGAQRGRGSQVTRPLICQRVVPAAPSSMPVVLAVLVEENLPQGNGPIFHSVVGSESSGGCEEDEGRRNNQSHVRSLSIPSRGKIRSSANFPSNGFHTSDSEKIPVTREVTAHVSRKPLLVTTCSQPFLGYAGCGLGDGFRAP
jgi:hypothetical protein